MNDLIEPEVLYIYKTINQIRLTHRHFNRDKCNCVQTSTKSLNNINNSSTNGIKKTFGIEELVRNEDMNLLNTNLSYNFETLKN